MRGVMNRPSKMTALVVLLAFGVANGKRMIEEPKRQDMRIANAVADGSSNAEQHTQAVEAATAEAYATQEQHKAAAASQQQQGAAQQAQQAQQVQHALAHKAQQQQAAVQAAAPQQADPFVDIPPALGTALESFDTFDNILGIVEHVKLWSSTTKCTLTTNLHRSLDSLMAVHDLVVSKLNLMPEDSSQTCDECSEEELEARYTLGNWATLAWQKLTNVTMATFAKESQGSSKCTHRLKKAVAMMRRSIKKVRTEVKSLLSELKETTTSGEAPYAPLLDRGCDGDCDGPGCDNSIEPGVGEKMKKLLEGFGTEPTNIKDHHGFCRDLGKDLSQEDVATKCQEQCNRMEGCRGFTLYNGEIFEYEEGSRPTIPLRLTLYGGEVQNHGVGFDNTDVGDEVAIWKKDKWHRMLRRCGNFPLVVAPPSPKCESHRWRLKCGPRPAGCWRKVHVMLQRKMVSSINITNRCCFRQSIVNDYTQTSTTCYKRKSCIVSADNDCATAIQKDTLSGLNTEQLIVWIENIMKPQAVEKDQSSFKKGVKPVKRGVMQVEKRAMQVKKGVMQVKKGLMQVTMPPLATLIANVRDEGINGLAFASMGKVELEDLGAPSEASERILCMIDAAKAGADASSCLKANVFEVYEKTKSYVDPLLFWTVKADVQDADWTLEFLQDRTGLLDRAKSYLKQYESVIDHAVKVVEFLSSAELVKQAVLVQEFSYLGVAASASFLINTGLSALWNSCPVIERWMMQTDWGATIDSSVDAVLTGK